MRGIDVAKWNEIKDYQALPKAGIEFAIVKVINKSNKPDDGFNRHIAGFASANIPVIAGYNYLYTTTEKAAREAARACITVSAGKISKIYADIEDKVLRTIPKAQLTKVIKAYQEEIENAGLKFGVYCSQNWYDNVIDVDKIEAPFWIARYGENNGKMKLKYKPVVRHTLDGWQYSSRLRLDGIVGDVDINEWYVEQEAADCMTEITEYDQQQFIQEMAVALGLHSGATEKQVLSETVSISTKTNRYHACVTAMERYMKQLGFYNGRIEADYGEKPNFGMGMAKATTMYQSAVVGLKKPDAVWTSRNKSYAAALGCR